MSGQDVENPRSVYLLTDYEPLRLGLVAVIENAPGLALVGCAESIVELGRDGSTTNADVFLIERDAVKTTGAELASTMMALPVRRVVMLATHGAPELMRDLSPVLRAMDGFALFGRDVSGARLVAAIQLVAEGVFLCDMDAVRWTTPAQASARRARGSALRGLSQREQQVLDMVARGNSNKEIAHELTVSEGTVKAHVSHIMAKLGAANRTELAAYVLSQESNAS